MGQYVDLTSLVKDIANEGVNDIKDFKTKLITKYKPAFTGLQQNLLNAYALDTVNKMSFEQRTNYGAQIREKIFLEYHNSIKGGASIVLKEDFQKFYKQYLEEEEFRTNLAAGRDAIFAINNQEQYIKTATQLMALVYSLRRDVNEGKEEHFALIYKGDSSIAKYTDIPVLEFLLDENILDYVELGLGNIKSWSGSISHSIRFKSSIGSQLEKKQLWNKQQKNFQDGKKFLREFYENTGLTKEYKKTKSNLTKLRNFLNDLGYNSDVINSIIREDDSYYVFKLGAEEDFQTGFVAQGLFGREVNPGSKYETFQVDNRDWYKGPDVISKDGQEYSVKSFLAGAPGLVSINSLYTVCDSILGILNTMNNESSDNDMANITNKLRTEIFDLDAAANKDIDKVFKILSG